MRIPASFKIGILEYKVFLTEKIEFSKDDYEALVGRTSNLYEKKLKNEGMLFGLWDSSSQTIWLGTKDIQGNDISKERLVSTFYHELAHALVGETCHNEANRDEIFIEALGKNLYYFCESVSDEDAPLYVDEDDDEDIKKNKTKTKTKC